jgi:hypothetical protein
MVSIGLDSSLKSGRLRLIKPASLCLNLLIEAVIRIAPEINYRSGM